MLSKNTSYKRRDCEAVAGKKQLNMFRKKYILP